MSLSPGAPIGRYRVVARLGGGGMGEVYRARDTSLERDVALKIISAAQAAEPDAAKRFAREAQAASALNHPNIVTVFDAGECEAGPYIVMELVEGRTLRSMLRDAMGSVSVVEIGRQIARALAAAHSAGIIHRDIKPENVMVRDDGYVKVLDFGLARVPRRAKDDADTTDASTAGGLGLTGTKVIGTAAYMAPEQARGEEISTASDVFALGLLFYEMATGRHPFATGGGPLGAIARMMSELPSPPSQLNPDIPAALDTLIARMLEKDPALRPDAAEVDRVLASLDGGSIGTAARVVALDANVVGRDTALREILQVFDETAAGDGRIVALAGEPGLGKTALAEQFLQAASSARPCLIARGRCSERDAGGGAAYLPWLELLDSMRGRTGSKVGQLMKTAAPTWHAQVAPLLSDDSSEARALTVNRAGSQQWMKRELAAFLEEAAHQTPLVVFIDDMHWADASTVELLEYVAPRLAASRVLVILTYRPSDLARSRHPFLSLKLELEGRGLLREMALGSLRLADVEQYLSLECPGHQFPASLAAFLYEKTEGLPLFMADALRTLKDRGVIASDANGWRLTQEVADFQHDIPKSIRSMIELTIARLDEHERQMLVAGAMQGVVFDTTTVARALQMDEAEVEDRLAVVAKRHALVRAVREFEFPNRTISVSYRFVHALYQNALYASLGPSRRASLSAAVADATIAAWGEQVNTRATELAYLFETARAFSRAAEFFLVASDRARQIHADREALALGKRGMDMLRALPPSPERDVRELGHLMSIALPMHNLFGYAASELEDTYERAQQLCDALGEHPQQFGVVTAIGAFHFMRGELGRAVTSTGLMTKFAEMVGEPVMRIWAAWSFGAVHGHIGQHLPECLARLDEGARTYDRSMHPAFMLMTGFDAGIGCRFQAGRVAWLLGDRDGAFARVDEAVDSARATRHPLMMAFALFFRAWVAQHDQDPERALPDARESLALADQYNYPHIAAWANVTAGWALALTSDVGEGERMIRLGLSMVEGIKLTRPGALKALAEVELLQGRVDDALSTLTMAAQTAARTEERYTLPEILRLTAEVGLQKDNDRHTAEIQLREALALAQSQQSRAYAVRIEGALARL